MKYTDRFGGQDSFWLTIHDDQWVTTILEIMVGKVILELEKLLTLNSIEQKLISNLDLNEDGRIGPPPNNDPVLTSQKATISDGQQNRIKSIDTWDLTQGYSDPDGDFIFVEEGSLSANNGSIVFGSIIKIDITLLLVKISLDSLISLTTSSMKMVGP